VSVSDAPAAVICLSEKSTVDGSNGRQAVARVERGTTGPAGAVPGRCAAALVGRQAPGCAPARDRSQPAECAVAVGPRHGSVLAGMACGRSLRKRPGPDRAIQGVELTGPRQHHDESQGGPALSQLRALNPAIAFMDCLPSPVGPTAPSSALSRLPGSSAQSRLVADREQTPTDRRGYLSEHAAPSARSVCGPASNRRGAGLGFGPIDDDVEPGGAGIAPSLVGQGGKRTHPASAALLSL
jgi:hypothetical protein